mgnify:CR=1 FL=1
MLKYLFFLPTATIAWLAYEWFEHNAIQYKKTTIPFEKWKEQPDLKLCLITDLHNNCKNIEKVTKKIREFAPELILLAGDMVDKHKENNCYAEQFIVELSNIAPVYYGVGNHEEILMQEHHKSWETYFHRIKEYVCFLNNEGCYASNDKKVVISGLSLPKEFYKKGSLYTKVEYLPKISIPKNRFHIMLAHNPEYAKLYGKYKADLILSGHLHGGLMRLPFIGGLVSPRLRFPGCDSGIVSLKNDKKLFISRGLGSHTIPLRFFNRVEINFLVVCGTKNKKETR